VPRLRSLAVVALLWVAALAGSSAPDGFSSARDPEMPLVAGMVPRPAQGAAPPVESRIGKRWALFADPDGKRWDLLEERAGKRWS
jgi:hypothetical protein